MSSPLFIPFTLQQHAQECCYATVDCICGCQVLLNNMELHLNEECARRQVSCEDCDEAMSYIELQVILFRLDNDNCCNGCRVTVQCVPMQ